MQPPKATQTLLNRELEIRLAERDAEIDAPQELMRRAQEARDAQQHRRAEHLSRRVLALVHGHRGALAILSPALRARNAPERALEATNPFRKLGYGPLIVSRAAAMCDLGMWPEAKDEVARALRLGGDKTAAFAVGRRIKSARPDLYDREP